MWMVMRRKWMIGFLLLNAFEVLVLTFLVMPAARAADADAAEAVDLSAVRTAIEAESDPELRAVMKEELEALESRGVESLLTDRDRAGSAPELIGPPVEGTGGGQYLPPAARAELEQIFSQGTGDPSKDGHLREQAEKVMEKYGVERPTFGGGGDDEGRSGGGLEQRGEGFERAMTEHMAPEAREQMERFMNERDMGSHEMSREGMEREGMERGGMERGGMERETMERDYAQPEREFGAPEREREYESHEREYEAPTHEYEAPEREFSAPEREYEAPTHEYEAPTHEYEAPTMESPTREYDPAEGSGIGPH